MNLEEYHILFVVGTLILILAAAAPVIGMVMPRSVEPFFAMGVLGENGMAEHYYPDDNSNIRVGSLVRWHVGVYNHMGSIQYVAVRFKILNSTLPGPDSSSCVPSSVPAFLEFRQILASNETWWFPFYWSISKTRYLGDVVTITELVVNNVTLGLAAHAVSGFNFRMVFELWVYDEASQGFVFAWKSGGDNKCVWTQIWFNVTLLE